MADVAQDPPHDGADARAHGLGEAREVEFLDCLVCSASAGRVFATTTAKLKSRIKPEPYCDSNMVTAWSCLRRDPDLSLPKN